MPNLAPTPRRREPLGCHRLGAVGLASPATHHVERISCRNNWPRTSSGETRTTSRRDSHQTCPTSPTFDVDGPIGPTIPEALRPSAKNIYSAHSPRDPPSPPRPYGTTREAPPAGPSLEDEAPVFYVYGLHSTPRLPEWQGQARLSETLRPPPGASGSYGHSAVAPVLVPGTPATHRLVLPPVSIQSSPPLQIGVEGARKPSLAPRNSAKVLSTLEPP